jgi:hypothetical protein
VILAREEELCDAKGLICCVRALDFHSWPNTAGLQRLDQFHSVIIVGMVRIGFWGEERI